LYFLQIGKNNSVVLAFLGKKNNLKLVSRDWKKRGKIIVKIVFI
jgi:hypothetical protein